MSFKEKIKNTMWNFFTGLTITLLCGMAIYLLTMMVKAVTSVLDLVTPSGMLTTLFVGSLVILMCVKVGKAFRK